MTKDKLYQNPEAPAEFIFNSQVAEVFDDMLQRSVPCYDQVIDMMAIQLNRFCRNGDLVYDLGCSTGTTLLELSRRLEDKKINFIGIDNSEAMIKKASLKAEMFSQKEKVSFLKADIDETDISPCKAFILNYTLQFFRPIVRKDFLRRLHNVLQPGGILLISEKIISHDPLLNRAYIDFYHDFKRSQGYSETEIARKRESLENILIPFSILENTELLQKAGFSHVEPFFQWFNFASFIAVKEEK
ncbi:MAG: carboxy-S-adenosyl-L-methionine synthase CmoA [Desulfobulbaceae bacterium]|nr:carboxy-S-adenosyl-L-methionine synthase CmoA [Desulfobulbaceae bacterium]